MSVVARTVVSAAVEGMVDEVLVRVLLKYAGALPGNIYGKSGKAHLREKIQGYNNAAQFAPWLVLVGLNSDAVCAPPLRRSWLPEVSRYMCFRIAVHEVEAWMLADRERMASFLSVSVARIPSDPEALTDPKMTMVDLARRSRRRDVREDMVPRPGSGRSVAPAYTSRLIEFVMGSRAP